MCAGGISWLAPMVSGGGGPLGNFLVEGTSPANGSKNSGGGLRGVYVAVHEPSESTFCSVICTLSWTH